MNVRIRFNKIRRVYERKRKIWGKIKGRIVRLFRNPECFTVSSCVLAVTSRTFFFI